MNNMENLLSALSATLIHSLWQAALITLGTWATLRFFSAANKRYWIATIGFVSILIACAATFLITLNAGQPMEPDASGQYALMDFERPANDSRIATLSFFTLWQQYEHLVLTLYAIGVFVFSFRIITGFGYLKMIAGKAQTIEYSWTKILDALRARQGIKQKIQLIESAHVSTPVVYGYIKPIILFPIGLTSGLTTKQVELILAHELAHIKRQDYLVNILQAVAEALLFFNPFVWLLSAKIRTEREQCCDDAVLAQGFDPSLYAHTLLQLEENKSAATLMLAAAGKKHELLNRIKRIMERNTKSINRDRFVPIAVITLLLMFVSWVSVNRANAWQKSDITANDTIPDAPSPGTASYSKTTIITFDENGEAHEQTTEKFEGDEALGHSLSESIDEEALRASVRANIAALNAIPPMPSFDFAFDFSEPLDTFPEFDTEELARLGERLAKDFERDFSGFGERHQADIERMMHHLERQMSQLEKSLDSWEGRFSEAEMKRLESSLQEKISHLHEELASEQQMESFEQSMKAMEESMRTFEEKFKDMELDIAEIEKQTHAFEEALRDQLVKDGYLKKNESINSFYFEEQGSIKVNGKTIKPADATKYRDLQKKYLKNHTFHKRGDPQ